MESNLTATFLKSTTYFRHNPVGRKGGITPFHPLSLSLSSIVWTESLLSMSNSQANTPGCFLSEGEKGIHCCILDFKAIGAQEGFAKMSALVIWEEVRGVGAQMHVCFPFSYNVSVEGRLAQGLPSCGTESNTKSVSNLLNWSMIQDDRRCAWHKPFTK